MRYTVIFQVEAASTDELDDSAARRAALLLEAHTVLKGPYTIKSMAVGRFVGSPGAGMGGKISVSAGRAAVPKISPLA